MAEDTEVVRMIDVAEADMMTVEEAGEFETWFMKSHVGHWLLQSLTLSCVNVCLNP